MFNRKKYKQIVVIKRNDKSHSKKINDFRSFLQNYAEDNNIEYKDFKSKTDYSKEKTLFVSLGGDGTFIFAVHQSFKCPNSSVIGFNAGNLGFLTETINQEDQLSKFLDDIFNESKEIVNDSRRLLCGQLKNGPNREPSYALNEFAISTNSLNHPFTCDVFVDDKYMMSQNGSGIVVSTPTGSTALSLSAGGAIVGPSSEIVQIVPIAAHTLTSRPVIIPADKEIKIVVPQNEKIEEFQISADGETQERIPTSAHKMWANNEGNVEFQISTSQQKVNIYRPKDWNFFEVLSHKMDWQ